MKLYRLTYICVLLTLSLSSCSLSQNSSEFPNAVPFSATIELDSIKKHVYNLASNEYQGRRTGEPGSRIAAKYIVNHYQSLGISYPEAAQNYLQKVPGSYMYSAYGPVLKDSENVWAFIPGTDLKDEVLVISAHYDHMGIIDNQIYYGADDNASGTSAVMEIARLIKQAVDHGQGPRRSVLFLHVTGEEFGLHGSRYYVEHPIVNLDKTIANLNIDMIGRRSPDYKGSKDYIFLVGSDRLSEQLHNLSERVNSETVALDLDYTFNAVDHPERIYYRSDHYNFVKQGIPAIFYYNGSHQDYHQPTDTPDKIDYQLMQKRTQLIFHTAWELLNTPERPKVAKSL